jgi:hypothetical protein
MVKRRQYLVEKAAQLKFVGLIIISFSALLLFMLWNVHTLLVTIVPAGILAANKQHITTFIIGTLVIISITAVVIIKYTHRFFGPISRLKKELTMMVEEKRYWHLNIREGDFLKELIESINLVIQKFMKQ